MSDVLDYFEETKVFEDLGISQYGYTVSLDIARSGYKQQIRATLSYGGEAVKIFLVDLVTGSDAKRPWPTIANDLRSQALAAYDEHNREFKRDGLLKAIEDRLNGVNAEMFVLTPGQPDYDDLDDAWYGKFF